MNPKKRIYKILPILLFTGLIFSCDSTITDPPPEEIIPTTTAEGAGGPAYLYGTILDYIHPSRAVNNTHMYLMNTEDYQDTVLDVFVNSTDASFNITGLPEGIVDIIFMHDTYLCAKLGKIKLEAEVNSFYNPNSSGYFIDSTVYITNIADSVGREDAPMYGLQGFVPSIIVVGFKWETSDSIAWEIVQESGCDTMRVWRYDDPVFDPFENDVYEVKFDKTSFINEKLVYFNWLKEVKFAGPTYEVIQH